MTDWLIEVDAAVLAALLGLLMVVALGVGWRIGRRAREQGEQRGKFPDAILALLGLLLAFTFSMSMSKHELRRQLLVADSNAIGDFYTCASLTAPPVRGKLQQQLRSYVEFRLHVAEVVRTPADLDRSLLDINAMHGQMQALVNEAITSGTPVVVPLVNTLNEMSSSHSSRVAAARDRLPGSITLLLVMTALVTCYLEGKQQGAAASRDRASPFGFVLLVSLVVWVTLDLNQPRRGMLIVAQEPMRDLLRSMQPPG